MPTTFPLVIDTLTNPTAADSLSTPTVLHHEQHSNINDAVEAIETKVGVDGSAVTSSIDYKLTNTSSTDPGHKHSVSSLTATGTPSSTTFLRGDNTWVSPTLTVSNSDGTLTISPTTGAVVASLALGHANTWTALQTFQAAPSGKAIVAKAAATTPDNIQEWQDSSDNVQARLNINVSNYGSFNLWSTDRTVQGEFSVGGGGVYVGSVSGSNVNIMRGSNAVAIFTSTSHTFLAVPVYSSGFGINNYLLNSAGTNYGTIQNDAADTWSLGTATAVGTLGTSILKWTKLGAVTLSQVVNTTGSPTALTVTGGAHTTLTASTEAIDVNLNLARTVQFATGALTTQRAMVIQAPTYGFVGASTITNTATVAITGAPNAGTNCTITNPYSLWTQSGVVRLDTGLSGGAQTALVVGTSTTRDLIVRHVSGITQIAAVDNPLTMYKTLYIDGNTVDINGFSASPVNVYGITTINAPAAGTKGLVVKGAASRTVALFNLQTSAGGSLGNVSGGCVFDVTADVATTSTDGTLDTLRTDTLVANALIVNGDKVYFDYTLTAASSATATSRFYLTFAGIVILDTGTLTIGAIAGVVRISGYVSRKSTTTARATIFFDTNATTILFGESNYVPDSTLTGLTLTGTNDLVLKAARAGTGAANGDIKVVQATGGITGFGS